MKLGYLLCCYHKIEIHENKIIAFTRIFLIASPICGPKSLRFFIRVCSCFRSLLIIRACIFKWFSDLNYVIFMWSKMTKYVVKKAKYVISKTPKVVYLSLKWGYFSNQRHKITNFSFSEGKLVSQMRILPL